MRIIVRILGGFGFLAGASYPLRALRTFQRYPYLLKYIIIPIAINLIIFLTGYLSALFFGWEIVSDLMVSLTNWLDRAIANLPAWLSVLDYLVVGLAFLVRLLLVLGLFVVTGFVLTQFGVILGAPWYGQLSEQLEKVRTGKIEIVEVGIVGDLGRALLFELKKLALFAGVGLPLLIVNFLPGFGTLISTVGGLSLTATIVCLDFLDGTLERRRLAFRQKLAIIWKSLPATAGFSLICLGLISIPLLNLFTIPLCVASGTLFACDRILPKFRSQKDSSHETKLSQTSELQENLEIQSSQKESPSSNIDSMS
jgi:CysZ protein